jgi:hypothetical protein
MNRQRNAGAVQSGDTRDLTIGSLINGLTLPHLWGAIAALAAVIVGSFYFGVWSTNFFANRKTIAELQFKNQFFETYLRYAISTDPELRPANTPDVRLASDHERAMSKFVEFVKRIDEEQRSNLAREQKVNVTIEKGRDQTIAVLKFDDGPSWPIPQQIKMLVHGLAP